MKSIILRDVDRCCLLLAADAAFYAMVCTSEVDDGYDGNRRQYLKD